MILNSAKEVEDQMSLKNRVYMSITMLRHMTEQAALRDEHALEELAEVCGTHPADLLSTMHRLVSAGLLQVRQQRSYPQKLYFKPSVYSEEVPVRAIQYALEAEGRELPVKGVDSRICGIASV